MKKSLIAIILSFFFPIVVASAAHGASLTNFNPGNIIDDYIFYNSTSMNANEIQDFLNSKVPTCDTNGTQSASDWGYPNLTHAEFAVQKGWQAPPYTCVRNLSYTLPNNQEAASGYCSQINAGTYSGAQIIYQVARACGINAQVLIVLLEKEQSLITDTWPLNSQLQKATGFACPDTAPCDDAFSGFFNQVYSAAKQFKIYQAYPNSYSYRSSRENIIKWHPDSSCGTSSLYIENQATAALYIYTPYRPNQAALNNLYGLGDSCSSYGNRNFWRIFSDWFGSPTGPAFGATFRAQSNSLTLNQGSTRSVYFQFINTGNNFWKDDLTTFPGYNPVHLATTNSINRPSIFKSSNWVSSSRTNGTFSKVLLSDGWNLSADQHTVNKGEIAEFQFNISVPSDAKPGTYREYFQPILEGSQNFSLGAWAYIDITVVEQTNSAAFVQQTSPYPSVLNGEQAPVYFKVKNTGTATWRDDTTISENQLPVHLATAGPVNRPSLFKAGDWLSSSRTNGTFSKVYLSDGITEAPDQHTVLPGQIAEFGFTVSVPYNAKPGTYREYFQPILEGARNYDMGLVLYLDIRVDTPKFKASYSAQSTYPTITRANSQDVFFKIRNTGNTFWKDDLTTFPGYNPVHLATAGPVNRPSLFKAGDWLSSSRTNGTFSKVYLSDGITEAPDQHTVLPGQIAEFGFTVSVPYNAKPGTYREYFQPILEGARNYDMGLVLYLDINVN